jgi:hypothetical protein
MVSKMATMKTVAHAHSKGVFVRARRGNNIRLHVLNGITLLSHCR